MKEQQARITILPDEHQLQGVIGGSLYTLLLVAGVISADDPLSDRLRLEKGAVSTAEDHSAEDAAFTPAEITEGWLLASQHTIAGDATFTLYHGVEAERCVPAPKRDSGYGVALRIGLGTISAGLVMLENMLIPLMTAGGNSLSRSDIASRLKQAQSDPEQRGELVSTVRRDVGAVLDKLFERTGVEPESVRRVCLCGQYTMTSLLQGRLPGEDDVFGQVICLKAPDVGLDALSPEAEIVILPAVSHDLGSATVAGALAAGLLQKKDATMISLMADLGMTGELLCAGRGRIVACSISSTPFEGAGIICGMPPVHGAITAVHIDDEVTVETVRQSRPRGLCGAGLLSAIHALRVQGMLDDEGRLVANEDAPEQVAARLRVTAAGREFVLSAKDKKITYDICLNQDDVLQMQLAKAAVFAACAAELAELGADAKNIAEIMLAESYRSNIRPDDVIALGMLPKVEPQRVRSVGGVSWQGAYLALAGSEVWRETEQLCAAIERLDLSSDHVYAEKFITAMDF